MNTYMLPPSLYQNLYQNCNENIFIMSTSHHHDSNKPDESQHPIVNNSTALETVTSRLHWFNALLNRFSLSFDEFDFAERQRVLASVGQEHPPRSQIAKSGTHWNVPDFRTPGPAHSVIIHNCGQKKHDEEYAFIPPRSEIPPSLRSQPSSCRKSFSKRHLYDKFGRTEIQSASGRHISDDSGENFCIPMQVHSPKATHEAQFFANPPLRTREARNLSLVSSVSHDTPKVERLKSARDMFTQYNISTPSGWLSDLEDLSLSRDGNSSPRSHCTYCHICSTLTWAPTYCSSCGHRFCERCMCEVSGCTVQALAKFSHHPSPVIERDGPQGISASGSNPESMHALHREVATAHSAPQSQNLKRVGIDKHHQPSNFHADLNHQRINEYGKESRSSGVPTQGMNHQSEMDGKQLGQMESQPKRAVKENPFIIRDRLTREQETKPDVVCDDTVCRATHAGHYPFRHSVSYSKHGSEQRRGTSELKGLSNEPPKAKISSQSGSDVTHLPVIDSTIHHRLVGPQNHYSIAEQLSSASNHDASDLVEERNEKMFEVAASKATIRPNPYLKRLTRPQPVTQINPFQVTQDSISPYHERHPGSLSDERQPHLPAITVATGAPDYGSHNVENDETAFEPMDITSEPAATHYDQREVHDDSNLSWLDDDFPKRQLASTPLGLKDPSKEATGTTARLYHVDTKRQETHEHDPGSYLGVTGDNWKGQLTTPSKGQMITPSKGQMTIPSKAQLTTSSKNDNHHAAIGKESSSSMYHAVSDQEVNRVAAPSPPTALHVTQHQDMERWPNPRYEHNMQSRNNDETSFQGELHSSSRGMRDLSSLVAEVPGPPYKVSEKRIAQATPERKLPLGGTISVLKRREPFESELDREDIDSATNKAHHEHSDSSVRRTCSRQAQYQRATSSAQGEQAQTLMGKWKAQETHSRPNAQSRRTKDSSLKHLQDHVLQRAPDKATAPTITPNLDLEPERGETKRCIERSSELEVATPRPIAPLNYECTWKEGYMALAAEIRQLKSEMSTRPSLRQSDITTSSHEEHDHCDDIDLQAVTIVLHLKDKEDIIVNTDLTQDAERSN